MGDTLILEVLNVLKDLLFALALKLHLDLANVAFVLHMDIVHSVDVFEDFGNS